MYRFIGTGVVWDKQHNKALCEFNRQTCTYETDDPREVGILKELDFDFEEFEPEKPEIAEPEPATEDEDDPLDDLSKDELLHLAEQNGIAIKAGLKKADIIAAINKGMEDEK